MISITQILTGLISALVGGILATYLKSYLDKKNEIELSKQKINEDKYRSMLIFMACALDINKKRYFSLNEQVLNETAEDYLNQIKEYYYHSILYSSDQVILSIKDFIDNPSQNNYIKAAKAMRKDIWGEKTKLTFDQIKL
ncbi:hypothetical protein [Pedobacter sp. N23S346]|uniref:hypothetical protein n=1 Tax=Pedobacter sp. N23S346 TaxID=3402750 RepID=UPI003ACB32C8